MISGPDLLQRLGSGARGAVPLAVTLVLVILGAVPYGAPALGAVMPLFPLMSVYYWAVYRPDLTPMAGNFGIGLAQDVLAGTPLGLSAALFVAVHAAVAWQRRFFHGKTFLVLWFAFAFLAAAATMLGWLLLSLYYQRILAPAPAFFQLLLTILLYPAVTWLFHLIHRNMLRA